MLRRTLLLALAATGCSGGGTEGSATSTSTSTSTDTSTATSATSAASTSATATASTSATGTATTEASTSGTASTTTTGEPGLTCPLADGPDVVTKTFDEPLFSEGVDATASPLCAHLNPERGLHQFVDMRSLTAGTLQAAKAEGENVVYGKILLADYRDAPLDAAVLAEIANGFDVVRAEGMKVVPRFHYSDAGNEPDATLARILEHISQLEPLLQTHADVILTLQAGFIGAWGEWHSSQNGLDAPGPRKEILDALLAALPFEKTVSVRRPSFKEEAYGGPLTAMTAHDGSALSRVGHVNDCFLASDSDFGTYQLPGEKDYGVADTAFSPMGGETCAANPPRSECPTAMNELALHHWTYINGGFQAEVLDSWKQDGCFDEIACRLGYRLVLREASAAAAAAAGEVLPVQVTLRNDGYAAPVNARPVTIVLEGPERFEWVVLGEDVRDWAAGEDVTFCADVMLPADAVVGTYAVSLWLPDAANTLAGDPRQAIRIGGALWDGASGLNALALSIDIE